MQSSPNSADEPTENTKLAFERTWLAEERTAMAWIRTATSLITFGFAIYSFFVIPTGAGHTLTTRQRGAAVYAVLLIALGLFSLAGAAIQRRRALKAMQAIYHETPPRSLAGMVGAAVAVMGLAALGILIFGI
jgi:inner membrane protein YidH